jgi:hypothetical protein
MRNNPPALHPLLLPSIGSGDVVSGNVNATAINAVLVELFAKIVFRLV